MMQCPDCDGPIQGFNHCKKCGIELCDSCGDMDGLCVICADCEPDQYYDYPEEAE